MSFLVPHASIALDLISANRKAAYCLRPDALIGTNSQSNSCLLSQTFTVSLKPMATAYLKKKLIIVLSLDTLYTKIKSVCFRVSQNIFLTPDRNSNSETCLKGRQHDTSNIHGETLWNLPDFLLRQSMQTFQVKVVPT